MIRIREAFDACISELQAHSQIAITHRWLGARATDEELARVEAAMGPLPSDVRAFYKQCNGAQLRWIDRLSAEHTERDDAPQITEYDWHIEGDDPSADGVIHFVPLSGLIENASGDESEEHLRIFDSFGASSGSIALLREGRTGPLTTRLTLGSDSNACWDDCDMTFAPYVEAVIGCRGHIDRRFDILLGRARTGWTLPLRTRTRIGS